MMETPGMEQTMANATNPFLFSTFLLRVSRKPARLSRQAIVFRTAYQARTTMTAIHVAVTKMPNPKRRHDASHSRKTTRA